MPLPMAREEKKEIKLTPVDDEVAPAEEVLRLDNAETGARPKYEAPIRLGHQDAGVKPSRLNVPNKEELELRTHQPDIETLIEAVASDVDSMEGAWGDQAEKRHPIPWGWFGLIGLVITGAVVWSLTHLGQSENKVRQFEVEAKTLLDTEDREDREAGELIEQIEQSLRDFFSAADLESLANHSRHPERVLPLMRAHYATHPIKPNPLRAVKALQPVTMGNRATFWLATVALAEGPDRDLILEFDSSGVPRVDWETHVCAQPMPWDQFAREGHSGVSLDFRVHAQEDNLYSHEFVDSESWRCFRLTTFNAEESLFGYVPVGSKEELMMLNAIKKNQGKPTSFVLRLIIPEQLNSPNGVVIEKVLSDRWIYIDPPEN